MKTTHGIALELALREATIGVRRIQLKAGIGKRPSRRVWVVVVAHNDTLRPLFRDQRFLFKYLREAEAHYDLIKRDLIVKLATEVLDGTP